MRKYSQKSNKKKSDQLGMSYGKATHKLKREIFFSFLKRLGENVCFRCGKEIETSSDVTVDHKAPWLDEDTTLFWNLDNIAFSHFSCNCRYSRGGRRKHNKCGKGHELTEDNTYIDGKNLKRCILCTRAQRKTYYDNNGQ